MEVVFLEQNDHEPYLPELELFYKNHRELKSVFLVQDCTFRKDRSPCGWLNQGA
jgi:hypothetical protein